MRNVRPVGLAAQVERGAGVPLHYLLGAAVRYHLAAALARAGAELEYVVRGRHRVAVVFDDEDGIADVAYRAQRVEQPVRIARVQPYRRLVEHVEDAGKLRAYLRREAYALALSARERVRAAREAQIASSDVVEKGEAFFHLDERDADDFLLFCSRAPSSRPSSTFISSSTGISVSCLML